MAILQRLFLFAFLYSPSVCFGAEPLELSTQSTSTDTTLVSLSQQLKEDLREVKALCWMRFSLNKALLSTNGDEGYQTGVKNDMALYIKANRILKLINTSSSEIPSSVDKLNRSSLDKLYREFSMGVQKKIDQERAERIAYKKLINKKKKEKGKGPVSSSFGEITNELPVLRQIKDILRRYASKPEIELTRFMESNVTCSSVNINMGKIIKKLDDVINPFIAFFGMEGGVARPELSNKPAVSLRDRLAFEKAHPKFSPEGGVTFPKAPSLP